MPEPFYTSDQLAELQEGFHAVDSVYERLLCEYLSLRLNNEAAYEYTRHGFVRRLDILKRCIENVYSIYPPEGSDKPSRNECLDLPLISRALCSMFLDASTILPGCGLMKNRSGTNKAVLCELSKWD